jgi:hypothetical protein
VFLKPTRKMVRGKTYTNHLLVESISTPKGNTVDLRTFLWHSVSEGDRRTTDGTHRCRASQRHPNY